MQSPLLTVAQASRIGLPIVYGLHDADGLFYVGKTTSPRARFKDHLRAAGKNVGLVRRVQQAGDNLWVEVIHLMPRDLAKAENDAIMANAAKLVNKLCNPYREGVHVPVAGLAVMPTCPVCGDQINRRNSKHCARCVKEFISPSGMNKAELRELANQAVAEFTAKH